MNILKRFLGRSPTSSSKASGTQTQSTDPNRFDVKRIRPDESSAGAYLRSRKIVFTGHAITNYGGLGCAPFIILNADEPDNVVGDAVLLVLKEAIRTPIPTQLSDFKGLWNDGLRTVGIDPANKLSYGAVSCDLDLKLGHLSIRPTNRKRGAFMHLPDLTIRIPVNSSPEQIGKALRDGFSKCT